MKLRELSHKLISKLEDLQNETAGILEQTHRNIILCSNVLLKLKKEIIKTKFSSVDKEIDFFKSVKPSVLSKLIYYKEIYTIEVHLPRVQKENQKKFINRYLDQYEYFFSRHIDFGQYINMNYTHFDTYYFTRKTNDPLPISNTYFPLDDPEFNTPGDNLLAQFKAYGQVVLYLKKKLTSINNENNPKPVVTKQNLQWTGRKIELIELIYALHASGVIKGQKNGIKELADVCENLFDIDLGNYYRKFLEIRSRKIERTKFLDSLKSNFIQRMKEADD